jgi:hypothetical protein
MAWVPFQWSLEQYTQKQFIISYRTADGNSRRGRFQDFYAGGSGEFRRSAEEREEKASPHIPARADFEKIRVLMMAVFCRNTLCISRKTDEIRARIFRKMPKTECGAMPKKKKEKAERFRPLRFPYETRTK